MAVETTAPDEAAHDRMRNSTVTVPAVPVVPARLQPLLQMCCPATISQLQHYSRAQPQFDSCDPASPRVVALDDSFTASALPASNLQKQDSQGDEVNQGEATTGRKRKSCKLWAHEQILGLLDSYQDKWVSLDGGNFKWKHWATIADDLNTKFETSFSDAQCKNKWDALKKTYLKEKARAGSETSRWEFYDRFTEVLAMISKVKGLGEDNGKELECNVHLIGEDEDNQDGFTSNVPSVEHDDANAAQEPVTIMPMSQSGQVRGGDANTMAILKDPIRMQRKKKKRRGSLGAALERGMAHFAEVMKEIEFRRIEADNKRWEKMLEMQMRIVEVFARRPG